MASLARLLSRRLLEGSRNFGYHGSTPRIAFTEQAIRLNVARFV